MRILTLAAPILALGTPAMAAAPILSGSYLLTIDSICQPTLTANFVTVTGEQRVEGLSLSNEETAQQLYTASFNPSTGKVKLSAGYVDLMSPFLLSKTGSQSSTTGAPTAEYAVPASTSRYKNTANSLKLEGVSFHAMYGQVDGAGVAHVVSLIGIGGAGSTCMFRGQAIHT